MAKKNFKMTDEERDIHNQAVKLRKMTDVQLIAAFRAAANEARASSGDSVRKLIEGLERGDCKGVKGATAYKISEYAAEIGLI